jgi:Oligosaccharyl transferase STT3, N-terminal
MALGALILLVIGAQRVIPSWQVLQRSDAPPALLGVDAYFHVRVAQHAATNFPEQLREDGAATFPQLGRQSVSGLFNLVHAAVMIADMRITGIDLRSSAYRTGAWIPVGLAMLTALLLLLFVRGLAGSETALLAGALFVLYPGTHLARSAYGFLDQHVLETLLALGALAGLHHCYGKGGRWREALVASIPIALFLISWLGAAVYFLHYALFAVILLVSTSRKDGTLAAAGSTLGRVFVCAAALFQVLVWLQPDLSMDYGGGITHLAAPALAGLGGMAWGYAALFKRVDSTEWLRRVLTVLLVAVATLCVFLIPGPLGDLVHRSFQFQPPDVTEINVTLASLLFLFGPTLLLALWGFYTHAILGAPVERAVAGFSAVAVALWLASGDFDYVPPVFVAIYAAVGALDLAARLPHSRATSVVGLVLLMVWPATLGKSPVSIVDSREAFVLYDAAWYEVMSWLEANTPPPAREQYRPIPTKGSLVPGRADYGIMTSWEFGNAIAELGKRSPRFGRFPSRQETKWLLATTAGEEKLARCPECSSDQTVAYAVLDASLAGGRFPFKLMRSQGLRAPPQLVRDSDDVTFPTFDAKYDSSVAVRLISQSGNMDGIEQVFGSSGKSVLYYRYDATVDRLERISRVLSPEWTPPWSASQDSSEPLREGRVAYYGIDTVSTVQAFRFKD